MEKIKYLIEKYKFILILIIIILILIICLIIKTDKKNIEPIVVKEENNLENEKEVINTNEIKIDIKGLVKKPGVYKMNNNDRVIDAIKEAGGLIENSNTDYLNLSKKLEDEMIIIIYSNDEVEKFKEEDKEIIYIEYECECLDNINEACINEKDNVNTNGTKSKNNDQQLLISINSNNIDELTKLTGIGESKAKAIIEYRKENGDFEKLEDIMNVPGIGESAYSKIKDNIKL